MKHTNQHSFQILKIAKLKLSLLFMSGVRIMTSTIQKLRAQDIRNSRQIHISYKTKQRQSFTCAFLLY